MAGRYKTLIVDPTTLPSHVPDASRDKWVGAALAKTSTDRPQSAGELAAKLGLSGKAAPEALAAAPTAAAAASLKLGATRPDHQPGGDRWRVLLDPAGHPFCLTLWQM